MKHKENLPKIKSEMQGMCSTCDELRKLNELLSNKCQIYERQIESLEKLNAETGSSLQESHQKIMKLNQVVALLTQQIAEKITENNMLRVESDVNNGGNVKEYNCQLGGNNPPDIDKCLEIKMEIPNEDDLREKETKKEQDVESGSEMEISENSDDINKVFEEAEDEETEASLNEKRTCAWIVQDDKGTPACCGRVFPSPEDLASHVKKDHLNPDRDGNYLCSWDGCKRNGAPFKSSRLFQIHFRFHSGERPYRCCFKGCGKAFAQMSALNSHGNMHSKTLHPCLDPGCRKVFSQKRDMMVHYKVRHTGEREGFACPVEDCGRVFDYKHVLAKHMGSHWRFQCRFPTCYQSFSSKQSLDEHSEAHKPVVGGHECIFDGCGLKFPDAKGLREHVKVTHKGEMPYVCLYGCGKAFSREWALKRHLIAHNKETDAVESP